MERWILDGEVDIGWGGGYWMVRLILDVKVDTGWEMDIGWRGGYWMETLDAGTLSRAVPTLSVPLLDEYTETETETETALFSNNLHNMIIKQYIWDIHCIEIFTT